MPLPQSFTDDELGALGRIAEEFGLKLDKVRQGRRWAIVRPAP